jgi:phage terminase small subunit
MRGRPRKPSKIRELDGNRSRRPIPPDLPLSGLPECPDRLSAEGQRHFRFVAAELGAIGVVKRIDSEGLTLLAQLWEACQLAHAANDVDALVKASGKWMTLAGRYGLTPSDRAKIMADVPAKADETEDRFFKVTG